MSVCSRHPVTLCSPLWMPTFTVGQTPPSFHGFDSLLSEAKLPASVLVLTVISWLWRADMYCSFSPTVVVSAAAFTQPLRGNISVTVHLHLAAWSWERQFWPHLSSVSSQSRPILCPPERTKVFARFWEVVLCVFSSVFHQRWRPV